MRNVPKTESTVALIRDMAKRMSETAVKLDRMATEMEERQDWDVPGEALNTISNLIPNLRIDLLAARPIREFQYRVADLENSPATQGETTPASES